MASSEITAWAVAAKRGASRVYFVGNLMAARFDARASKPKPAEIQEANAARQLSDDGLVLLTQRLGDGGTEYLATRSRRRFSDVPLKRGRGSQLREVTAEAVMAA